ncbi:MAG: carboxylate--amine ligase, partial [Ruaniaceae bacterium]|nr:carboxylate--amine ligase [Ruaniaceae bacterium]
ITDTIPLMLEELMPVAEDLDCAEELELVNVILEKGASYQRQHRAFEEGLRPMEAVVRQLVTEMKLGRPV